VEDIKDLARRFESLTRELGVRIGRSLVDRMVADRQALADAGVVPQPTASNPPVSAAPAKLLPGLSGRRRRPGEPPPKCGRPGCDRPSRTRGYCQTHYVQWLKNR
jgi:hypothetical protein